jgi:hypothetical protein
MLLKIQLIKAKKYAELTNYPVLSMPQAIQKIEETMKDLSNEYVDGIMHTADLGVIGTARLADDIGDGVPVQQLTRATDLWFYLYAKKLVTARKSDYQVHSSLNRSLQLNIYSATIAVYAFQIYYHAIYLGYKMGA